MHRTATGNIRLAHTPEPYVFVSHSSKDNIVVSAVKQAFQDLEVIPYFAEETAAGVPPSTEIAEAVKKAEALFVFFTTNSLSCGDTRDWIVFEIGIALAHGKRIYSWKEGWTRKDQLPRLLEQVSKYMEFATSTSDGTLKLVSDIREIAKKL